MNHPSGTGVPRDGGADDDRLPPGSLEALRSAFDALPAPPPARSLDEEDALTQGTVAWLAAAFRAMPVPAAAAPVAPIWPLVSARTARRVAAAAALLAVALGAAWWWTDGAAPGPRRTPVAESPRGDDDVPPTGPPTPSGPAAPTPVVPQRAAPRLVAAGPDHIELSSGPVRLLLFTDSPDVPPETPR